MNDNFIKPKTYDEIKRISGTDYYVFTKKEEPNLVYVNNSSFSGYILFFILGWFMSGLFSNEAPNDISLNTELETKGEQNEL